MVAVVSAVLMAAIFLFQLNNYEKAFLDIYGVEQDGYVKVTLDQIGRLGEDATEEKITDIISSLDSDSSKYWTLSTGDNIRYRDKPLQEFVLGLLLRFGDLQRVHRFSQ